MPKLSPTMEEGVIASWAKKEGDFVEVGDVLFEVSTDKATVEYNALDSGWLKKIIVQNNGSAVVNQAVAVFTENKDDSIEGYMPTGVSLDVKPEISENVATTDLKIDTEASGTIKKSTYNKPVFQPEPPLENYEFNFPTEMLGMRVRSSPLARKIAADKGLDITTVQGTGPGGRVMKNDLEKAQTAGEFLVGKGKKPTIAPGTFIEEQLSPIRKVIGDRLQDAKSFIPHFYVQQAVQVDVLVELRNSLSSLGLKVSYNDCVIRACALALRKHMEVNSGFNSANNTIIRFKTIDISVAVNMREGLITPIIRHADFKNVAEISVEMKDLAKKAKAGKLKPEEYKGGSFTISNMGMYGVSSFQAIINPPQAAILAISGIQDVPVIKNGIVVPGKLMNISLSADHRVIDGALAAEFIKSIQHYLENPASLLLV
jgi:pyruvate dehydrogenase E2 component (dihydrolipoamide acetyltransferase)